MSDASSTPRRLAVVMGGAMGIGGACVRAFAAQGWAVAILDRDAGVANTLATELSATTEACSLCVDITSQQALADAITAIRERFPERRIHAAVNSAGKFDERDAVFKTSLAAFRSLLDVNVIGAFLFSQAVEPLMDDGASLIHIGSVNGLHSGGGLGAYKTTKAALHMLARCMARELAHDPRKIRVNVVAPGWVDTPGERRMLASHGREADLDNPETAKWIPLGRRTYASEIANTVMFLCSDAASATTGQILFVDGGMSA